jgi:hypothetical protein
MKPNSMKPNSTLSSLAFVLAWLPAFGAEPASSGTVDEAAELALKLQNPVASLISLPLQANWDFGIGVNDASRFTLNVQPVIPLALGNDVNLIIRTIMPLIDAESPAPGIPDASGLGDITQSFFFSPKAPTAGGWILGAGPVFLWPTATDDLLGAEKWGAGPTALALRQSGGWTYGVLTNHLWSFAGENTRADVNATFVQPFLSYITKTKTTFGINTEASYDWNNTQWSVPVNLSISQLFKIGGAPMQFSIGGRYYAEGPTGGPEWGLRAVLTFLFPK